jgi:putative ATP-dependent endonuclease of OLD family
MNKDSYFNQLTATFNTPNDKILEIERLLHLVNESILTNSPSINKMSFDIWQAYKAIGLSSDSKIEAVPSKLSDINRSIDILFQNGGAKLSISLKGQGARCALSIITPLIHAKYMDETANYSEPKSDQLAIYLMEEPETHFHPHVQRQIYRYIIENFIGQTITSTHSASIITQAAFSNCVCFTMKNGRTKVGSYPKENIDNILRIVSIGHYDMLYASAIVMGEGMTEERALPIFFY